MINNSERGVSLIITFFIMTIILSVVMAISTILYSEIKIIRNIGNSVGAFYLADSGAEEVLYYDRRAVPTEAVRGICNICSVVSSCSTTSTVTDGCQKCTDCNIAFTTTINSEKSYNVDAHVSVVPHTPCDLFGGDVESYGTYMNTKRAINLNITGEVKTGLGPSMSNPQAIVSGNGKIAISVTLSPYPDCKKDSVTAYIYDQSDGSLADTVELTASGQCNYSKPWQGVEGKTYYISIGAYDANGYCASVTIIPG